MQDIQHGVAPAANDKQRIKLSIPSRKRSVRAVVQFVRELLLSMDLAKKTIFHITLSLEEAITNIIRHAYDGDETKEIIATCELDSEKVIIRLRDFGRQVDRAQIRSRELDDYRPGGLGVRLMQDLMDGVEYNTNFDIGTELTLVKTIRDEDRYRDDALWDAIFSVTEEADGASALADEMTGLPTVRGIAAKASALYQRDGTIGVLLLDAKRFPGREQLYPGHILSSILSLTAKALLGMQGEIIHSEDLLATNRPMYDDFVLIVSAKPRGGGISESALGELAQSIQATAVEVVPRSLNAEARPFFGMRHGEAVVSDGAVSFQHAMYLAIKEAGRVLARRRARAKARLFISLRSGLEEQEVRTLYQPIVGLRDLHVLGYEAFSNLMKTESIAVPEVLFDMALEASVSWELDRLCMQKALARHAEAPPDAKFFLNIEAESLLHPECSQMEFVRAADIAPERVVLEIGVHSTPRSWDLLYEAVCALRRQGVSLCVSDVQSDLMSLALIDRLQPEFVKFSPIVVRGCPGDPFRSDVLRTLVARCRHYGCTPIALGIETGEDLEAVSQLGLDYAQGYYVAEPSQEFSVPEAVPSILVKTGEDHGGALSSEAEVPAEMLPDTEPTTKPKQPESSGSDTTASTDQPLPSTSAEDKAASRVSLSAAPGKLRLRQRGRLRSKQRRGSMLAAVVHPLQFPARRRSPARIPGT